MIGGLISAIENFVFGLIVAIVLFFAAWLGIDWLFGWGPSSVKGFLVVWGIIFAGLIVFAVYAEIAAPADPKRETLAVRWAAAKARARTNDPLGGTLYKRVPMKSLMVFTIVAVILIVIKHNGGL